MSRVGKKPITLPQGVDVKVSGDLVTIKGKGGEHLVPLTEGVAVQVEGSELTLECTSAEAHPRAMFGTLRAVIANAVQGVSEGFTRQLEIQGVGYRAQLQGKKLVLNVGFCHTVEIEAPEGITFTVPEPTRIDVTGSNKQQVGQVAADIRAVRKPEPYKGKGIRYVGEAVRRKAGKQGK
ncbi:MAG: 50S ribosomal protein L6 [Planctomycetota bacterium]|jgi:large subunit ribosomal protein L6|nr:50S ribosomal protein L6 [Planctomycetota bacterium]